MNRWRVFSVAFLVCGTLLLRASGQAEAQVPEPFPPQRAPLPADVPAAADEEAIDDEELSLVEEPLPKPESAELHSLASGLASESFEIREKSQAALGKYARQHPEAVRQSLAKVYVDSHDPEVRYRLAEVLYDAVVDEMEHSGFLGIIMVQSSVQRDGRLISSIQVSNVLRNSAAARAGLRPGDQIIQVDDLKFDPLPGVNRATPSPNLVKFKDYISARAQGTTVNVTVQRLAGAQPQVMEIPVELGRRTRELMEPEELKKEDAFFEKWLKETAARETAPAKE